MPFEGPCRRACTMVESSRTWNNWSRRSCCSGVHCHRGSLMAVLYQPVEASPAGCRTGEWWRYWTQLAVDICTLALLFVADVVRDELFAGVHHMIFFQVVCLRQSCWSYVAPSSVLSVYCGKICIKFASHHLLLYVLYMCQKSLNFTYAFKCYQQKCKWLHFSWATLYIASLKRNRSFLCKFM